MPYKGQEIMVTGPAGMKYKSTWSHVLPDGRDVILGDEGEECILPEYTPIDFIEPAPEEKPSPVKPGCMYEVWSKEAGAMVECGAEAGERCLCPEHLSFVKDSTEGPFTKSKKPHPAGYDWNKKACAAYGVKGLTMATMGKPSDAGKAPYMPCTPAESAAWAARQPLLRDPGQTPAEPAPAYVEVTGDAGIGSIAIPVVDGATITEQPAPVTVNVETAPQDEGREALADAVLIAACRRLMEQKEKYKGTGIPGVLWSIGFRQVYQNGRAPSDKQIAAARAIVAKQPERYAALIA